MTAIQYVHAHRIGGLLAVVFIGWCTAIGGVTFAVIAGRIWRKRAAK